MHRSNRACAERRRDDIVRRAYVNDGVFQRVRGQCALVEIGGGNRARRVVPRIGYPQRTIGRDRNIPPGTRYRNQTGSSEYLAAFTGAQIQSPFFQDQAQCLGIQRCDRLAAQPEDQRHAPQFPVAVHLKIERAASGPGFGKRRDGSGSGFEFFGMIEPGGGSICAAGFRRREGPAGAPQNKAGYDRDARESLAQCPIGRRHGSECLPGDVKTRSGRNR